MAEPDQFADFNPQTVPAGGADEFADFNPSPLPKTAPENLIPQPLMRRFVNPGIEGAEAGMEGISASLEETRQKLQNVGIYRKPGEPLHWYSGVQFLNQAVGDTVLPWAEALLRAPNAILEGAGAIIGQHAADIFGENEANQARARRDMANMVSIAGLLAGSVEPYARQSEGVAKPVDHSIGVLPKEKDFQTAAQVIAQQSGGTTTITINGKTETYRPDPAIIADKAIRLHEEFGIHPAEIAHDAANDNEVAASMLSKQIADLPRKYTTGEKSEDTKLDEEAGVKPAHIEDLRGQRMARVATREQVGDAVEWLRSLGHDPSDPAEAYLFENPVQWAYASGWKQEMKGLAPPAETPPVEPAAAPQPATQAGHPAPAVTAPAEPAVAAAPVRTASAAEGWKAEDFRTVHGEHVANVISPQGNTFRFDLEKTGDNDVGVSLVVEGKGGRSGLGAEAYQALADHLAKNGQRLEIALIKGDKTKGELSSTNAASQRIHEKLAERGAIFTENGNTYVTPTPLPVVEIKKRRSGLPANPEHYNLLQFLASEGGLKPEPEVLDILGGRRSYPVPHLGNLIRNDGMSVNEALLKAVDEKFLFDRGAVTGGVTTPVNDDLLDLLDKSIRSKEPQYRAGVEPPTKKGKRADIEAQKHDLESRALDELEKAGITDIPGPVRDRMVEILMAPAEPGEVRDPTVAWEQAVMEVQSDGAQTGEIEHQPENIPGWDVPIPNEPGAAPPGGAAAQAGRGEFISGGLGEAARPTGEPNREPNEQALENAYAEGLRYGEAQPETVASHLPKEASARGYKAGPEHEEFIRGFREGAGGPSLGAASVHDMPPIGVGGAGMPRANPYFTYDEPKFSDAFQKAIAGWQKTFQPELVSDRALQADPLFAEYKSRSAAEHASIIARSEAHHQFWRDKTDTERIDYIDRLERQAPMPDEWKLEAYRHRVLLDEAAKMEAEFGSKAGYVEDYFPHMWLDPDKARGFVNTKVAQLGPSWFQKERTFDTVREGLEAGLRLKWTNPDDLVTYRLLSGADMRERMRLLQGLEEQGLAKPVRMTTEMADVATEPTMLSRMGIDTRAADELMRNGWSQINAPNREAWLISPDAQPLWKNAVEAKGLWANEGAIGSAFRGWMGFKAAWVPIKLSLSLFHPLHVVGINVAQGMGRGMVQLIKTGDLEGALQSVAQGFNMFPSEGRAALEAWRVPANERTPAQAAQVDLMTRGGFVPQMTEEMRINAKRGLEEAWDKSQYLGIAYHGMRRAIEVMQAPIFEKWIPSLKAAAYLNDAQALLARRPELLDNPIQQGVALRTIAKSVDNRFGQMFYGNLFWDRYVKDAGIGTFLSLGWQTGGIREFGGAFMGPAFRTVDRMMHGAPSETRATITDAQNKLSFALAYVGTMMLVNGMMSWGLSGQAPEGLDWFLARVGGTNPDGSPRRITNMSYLREVPMLLKHIQEQGGNVITGAGEMLYNKMMIEPIREMWNNRDYYGSDIWDVNGQIWMKGWQGAKHVFGDQMSPITISGANRALLTGGQWYEALLATMGFGPAPSYAARDAAQNRIAYLYDRHVAPFARPEDSGEKSRARIDIRSELVQAQKAGDQEGLQKAANKWMENGGSRLSLSNVLLHIPSDVTMFRALPQPDQEAVMKGATPEQQAKYKPYLKSDIVVRAANLTMQAEMQRKNNNNVGAAATEQLLNKEIGDAARDGKITNISSFYKSLTQQLTARHAPEIAAIMAQPKKDRARYQQQLQAPQ